VASAGSSPIPGKGKVFPYASLDEAKTWIAADD
jgi:hypothetical protein